MPSVGLAVGYARVSTVDQNLALQRDALTEAGCAKIFTEQMSGAVTDRPALHDALEFARSGDTICEREFLSPRARGAVLAGGSGTLRTGEIAPHLRFVKTGPESSRIELANAGQLTVNRGLVFTMSLESLLDLRRPAVHCTRRPPRREQMACRFRPVDRNASAVLHIEKHLFSRARGDKNSGGRR